MTPGPTPEFNFPKKSKRNSDYHQANGQVPLFVDSAQLSLFEYLIRGNIPQPDALQIIKLYWAYTHENFELAEQLTHLTHENIPEEVTLRAVSQANMIHENFLRTFEGQIPDTLQAAIFKYVIFKELSNPNSVSWRPLGFVIHPPAPTVLNQFPQHQPVFGFDEGQQITTNNASKRIGHFPF